MKLIESNSIGIKDIRIYYNTYEYTKIDIYINALGRTEVDLISTEKIRKYVEAKFTTLQISLKNPTLPSLATLIGLKTFRIANKNNPYIIGVMVRITTPKEIVYTKEIVRGE